MSENDSKKGEKPDEGQMSKEEGEVLDQHSPDIKVRVGEWMVKCLDIHNLIRKAS